MRMIDSGEGDDKIIAVPISDPRWDNIKDLKDLNEHAVKEFKHFFETYKKIEEKTVEISGVEGREEAIKAVEKSIELYKEKFGK